ncbi:MAG: ABC transporter ATP-binding protein, partial [Candidatus Binatia bacterium]
MLRVDDITVRYGEQDVLRGVSFELKEGETIVLLGENGAGKTTLMRAVNGTLPIAKGEIAINKKEIACMSRREIAKNIAVVAQENETRFPVTVSEFVLSGRFVHGGVFGWESETDVATARKALEECDLAEYETRLMNHLSGGERQRVVLARALATGAKILLLDEPTANLDLAHQAMMFRLVRERCDKDGFSAIVITHDLNLASEFADEIVLLKSGEIAAKGRPEEVLN